MQWNKLVRLHLGYKKFNGGKTAKFSYKSSKQQDWAKKQ